MPVKFDTWNLAVFLSLEHIALYQFCKLAEGSSRLNPASLRNAGGAVEFHVHDKPSFKCRGEYAKFTPEHQVNITCCPCNTHSPLM